MSDLPSRPLKLRGSSISYFTGKMENYFRLKGIPYQLEAMDFPSEVKRNRERVGVSQMPVVGLPDGRWMTDTTKMIQWFETEYPQNPVVPEDPVLAYICYLLEDWADTTLAMAGRSSLVQAAALDPELRVALLPDGLPDPVRSVMGVIPGGWVSNITELVNQKERTELLASLEQLASSVQTSPWLVGDSMTLADIAVAAQLSLLRFPSSAGSALAGKGVPGLSDHPKLQPLFQWRDQIELKLMERTLEEV